MKIIVVEIKPVEVVEVKDSLDLLRDKMHEHVVHFKYKKLNGDVREAFGTLKDNLVKVKPQGLREPSPEVFTYWDLEVDSWRCFRKENFIEEIK